MRIYSLHIRRDGLDPDHDIVLVKEGFSWPAALFAPLWALWCGLWAVAAGMILLIAGAVAVIALLGLGAGVAAWLAAGLATMAGFFANDLMRATLARRGFALCEIVVAANKENALFRVFDRDPRLAADVRAVDTKGAKRLT